MKSALVLLMIGLGAFHYFVLEKRRNSRAAVR
ncbi:hypothetical protein PO124_30175 [Bacillus licheniformis]|nr:hypothetical protein [Bacillus licheniformis]